MKTFLAATGVTALAIVIVGFSWWKRCERISGCYDRTVTGQNYESVISCFGDPEGIHTSDSNDGYYLQNAVRQSKEVHKVIVYPFFFVNIASVNFDENEKVVGKYMYSSP